MMIKFLIPFLFLLPSVAKAESITIGPLKLHLFETVQLADDYCPSFALPIETPASQMDTQYKNWAQANGYVYRNMCKGTGFPGSSKEKYVLYKTLGDQAPNQASCELESRFWYNDSCNSTPDPNSSITPEQQCLNDGKHWYNNTCNDNPEPTPQEQCEAQNKFWYNDSCHNTPEPDPITDPQNESDCIAVGKHWYNDTCNDSPSNEFEVCKNAGKYWYTGTCHNEFGPCNSLKNDQIVRNKEFASGDLDDYPYPPDSICNKPGHSTNPYDGCLAIRSGASVLLNSSWSAGYAYTGKPCFANVDTENQPPAPETQDADKAPWVPVYSDICATHTTEITSNTSASELPQKLISGENYICVMELDTKIGTNPVNGCSKYRYKGLANTLEDGLDHLSDYEDQCDYNEKLDCPDDQFPSEDGSKCESIEVPVGSVNFHMPAVSNQYTLVSPYLYNKGGVIPIDMTDTQYLLKHLEDFANSYLSPIGRTSYKEVTGRSAPFCLSGSFENTCYKTSELVKSVRACSMLERGVYFGNTTQDHQNRSLVSYRYEENFLCVTRSQDEIKLYGFNDNGVLTLQSSHYTESHSQHDHSQQHETRQYLFEGFDYDGNPETGDLGNGGSNGTGEDGDTAFTGDKGQWNESPDKGETPTLQTTTERLFKSAKKSPLYKAFDFSQLSIPEKPNDCSDMTITMPWFDHPDPSRPMHFVIDYDAKEIDIPMCDLLEDAEISRYLEIMTMIFWSFVCLSMFFWLRV